jgi:hypothetical protein
MRFNRIFLLLAVFFNRCLSSKGWTNSACRCHPWRGVEFSVFSSRRNNDRRLGRIGVGPGGDDSLIPG